MSNFIHKSEFDWERNEEINQILSEALEKKDDDRILADEEKYILERIIIRNGITLFSGFYSSGKSWLILFLIKNILCQNVLDYKIYETNYKVLYLTENPREIVNERKRLLDFNSSSFFVIGGKRIFFDDREERKKVSNFMLKNEMNILILDPMRLYFSGDENKSHVIRTFFDGLKRDFCQKGISVILTHHRGKGELNYNETIALERKPKSLPARGSSDIGASCDIILNIRRTPRKDRFEIVMEQDKNVLDPELEPLIFDFTALPNVFVSQYFVSDTITEKFSKEFFDILENSEEAFIYRERALTMMKEYGGSQSLFEKLIKKWKDEGKIKTIQYKGKAAYQKVFEDVSINN
jgi:hypothetical protein